jgi:hypothetical protein
MRLGKRAARLAGALAACGCASVVAVATAVPAQAMRPSTADLKDADGHGNGCVVTVTITKTTLPGSPELGPGIFANTVVSCPRRANIHRVGFSQNFVEVLNDGDLRTIGHGSTGGTSQAGPPITIPVSSGQFSPCASPDNEGTHTYFVRARVSAKEQPTFRDPHPYVGKVASQGTLTC